ncbi:hypothetical protein AALO_G00192710 [Alosa alosa]|uniref:FERM and PDZ domain-containing protein 1-like n=1 Tax=Alosa alosa TaxID=278164 RepID=A0AAV6G6J0_9TELE|nr:FERM and PDZ domain-containing protein 1 [Alosa alosa]XP_048118532.1 FERM and PDZ domain-containing protein 1 [Alosa alosa]KAG5270445.1 hypothetical protein AALO_G00192710 [Alosa alosa]
MEEGERSRSRSPRRASRVEQVVGRWLRRSRDSLSRERILDGKSERSSSSGQQNFPVKVTVEIIRDEVLDSHGFSISTKQPLLVRDVIAGGPADGRILPGDQLLKVNNTPVEDLPPDQVQEMIGDSQESITVTVLRHMSVPKSSLMTAEKRARLRRNPVKVRFAEEVLVNGHTQGNSLLFLPNVLKVYLENGQTKAFKFDNTTTVKDIILTLKDKLSIRSIEYFSLVLEQQYSITKLLLLHEEELIQKVVQKKGSHDYRCLLRVCFIPRDPLDLLQDDPVAFEYLFHQSVGDVLQERFAVEMKCNTALRLAALHIHERLSSCGQTHRASVKSISKEFGLDSFISPTLMRNMREKDLRKALNYHLKKIQSLLEPRQKVISMDQARLAYLTQMAELISYSGRSYNATMLLQDRESLVSLLVGARYGISQVLNHKLNMISTIIDFHYITRVELLSESERVSMLKIYLQDIKPLALLMDSLAAKDLACLLAGYCRLLVDPNMNVFRWGGRPKMRRIPVEEEYLSRCGSDSDDSSDEDYPMDAQLSEETHSTQTSNSRGPQDDEDEATGGEEKDSKNGKRGKVRVIVTKAEDEDEENGNMTSKAKAGSAKGDEEISLETFLETAWYHTDPRVNSSFSSLSSNSLSALEENFRAANRAQAQLDALREKSKAASQAASNIDVHSPYLLDIPGQLDPSGGSNTPQRPSKLVYSHEPDLCYADLSQADSLPSPPEATDDELDDDSQMEDDDGGNRPIPRTLTRWNTQLVTLDDDSLHDSEDTDLSIHAVMTRGYNREEGQQGSSMTLQEEIFGQIFANEDVSPRRQRPSGFPHVAGTIRDSVSESEDEFFDAQDRFTPPLTEQEQRDLSNSPRVLNVNHINIRKLMKTAYLNGRQQEDELGEEDRDDGSSVSSFLQSRSAADSDMDSLSGGSLTSHPTVACLMNDPEEVEHVEPKPTRDHGTAQQGIQHSHGQCNGDIPGRNTRLSSELLEMEPDTMEFKPVTSTGPPRTSPLITAVRQTQPSQGSTEGTRNAEKETKQANGIPPPIRPKNHLLLKVPDPVDVPVSGGDTVEKERSPSSVHGRGGRKSPQVIYPPPRKEAILTPTSQQPASPSSTPPSSLRELKPASPVQSEGDNKDTSLPSTPNGLTFHPWEQRNGVTPTPGLSKGVSVSHENLRTEKADAPKMRVGSASTTPTPTPSPMVPVRSPISGDPSKESVGTTSPGLGTRNGSSGRLSTAALRGRIQDLPWYLTRSQEILGTAALEASSVTELKVKEVQNPAEPQPAGPKETKNLPAAAVAKKVKEKGAEVVIAKLKDGPEEVLPFQKETNGKAGAHPSFVDKNGIYKHLGSCKCEQPQSNRDKHPAAGPDGPPAPVAAPNREPCGCRTVYANCFSGDAEDSCGFDDEMTVYEFSRRNPVKKPPPVPPQPVPPATDANCNPSPNVLSLLRDTPNPLSTSSELSPLLAPPRPLEPRPLELGLLGDPLRSLQGRRYSTGQRGTSLKAAYAALRSDIDELLVVLEAGMTSASAPALAPPSGQLACCNESAGTNGHSLSDAERCLLQTEARRLASGCQRATRVGWAPDDALLSLGNSFSALVYLSAACLRVNCTHCGGSHSDIDGKEALGKLQEIVGLYNEFVAAVETAREGEGVRLLAKQCTVLISTVFSLTQLFRTRTPDTDYGLSHLSF